MKIIQYFICFLMGTLSFVYADDTSKEKEVTVAEEKEVIREIKLQNHVFEPAEIYVPSKKKNYPCCT